MDKKIFILANIVLGLICASFASAQTDIEVSSLLLKTTLNQGDSVTKSLNIQSATGGDFEVAVLSVPGVRAKQGGFFLEENGRGIIEVEFNSRNLAPGIYVGVLEISGSGETLGVPIIFEVESQDVFFDANIDIPPVYTEIERGTKIIYQLRVFDLTAGGGIQEGLGPTNVEVEYSIVGLDGSILLTRNEQLVVNKQSQLTNTINFPSEIEAGSYVLSATVKYQTSIGLSSQTFEIVEGSDSESPFDFSDYYLVIAVSVALLFFLGMIFLFVYLLRERDKVLLELRRYNEQESKKVIGLLKEQEKILLSGQRARPAEVEKETSEKIKKLKEKQRKRVEEISKLQRAGEVEEMKRKLDYWKSQGYGSSPTEYKLKNLSTNEMQKALKKWKSKYSIKDEKAKNIKMKKTTKNKR